LPQFGVTLKFLPDELAFDHAWAMLPLLGNFLHRLLGCRRSDARKTTYQRGLIVGQGRNRFSPKFDSDCGATADQRRRSTAVNAGAASGRTAACRSIEVHDLAIENGLTGQHSAMPSQSAGKDL